MKAVVVSIALLSAFGGIQWAGAQAPKANNDPALLAAQRKYFDALLRADTARLDAGESKLFTIVTPVGIASRDEQFSKMRERHPDGKPLDSPNTYSFADQTVQIYGDVAVLSELCTVNGDNAMPIVSPGRYWVTEVWRKEKGIWKIVHLHATPFEHGM